MRRYVFKNASIDRYKNQLAITTVYALDPKDPYAGIDILETKYYNIVKGKLVSNPKQKLTHVNDWLNGYETKFFKANKEISMTTYIKIFNRLKPLYNNSYWSKLFNATKNFS